MQLAFNRPVLLEPSYAGFFYAYLSHRMGATSLQVGADVLDREGMEKKASAYGGRASREDRSYEVYQGVSIIPVSGTLVNRGSWMDAWSGVNSYESLRVMIAEAEADEEVRGHFFEFDTPGGAVAGCFDFCDWIRDLKKPTAGFSNEDAYSAGYAIASQLGRIYVPRTGGVGSVGVLMAHYDYSNRLEQDGVKVTLVHSGVHKIDGNPYEALPPAVRNRYQVDLDATRQLFAETVARGRRLSVREVLETEAQLYSGQDAVDIGFADVVASKDDAFADFVASLSSTGGVIFNGASMSDQTLGSGRAEVVVQPSMDVAQVTADATQAEASRIFAILESSVAVGRMDAAIELAKAGMESEKAIAVLGKIPAQSVAADKNAQALQMMSAATPVDAGVSSESHAQARKSVIQDANRVIL